MKLVICDMHTRKADLNKVNLQNFQYVTVRIFAKGITLSSETDPGSCRGVN
jgi:hypothetical protein